MYDRNKGEILHFSSNTNAKKSAATQIDLDDPVLADMLGKQRRDQLIEDIELLDGASCDFDLDRVRHGKLSPVFFGSALTTFGVEPFLEAFLRMTTPPLPRHSSQGEVDPQSDFFSAFVFKIQANMNKAHRDRIAFRRVCSGHFEADKEVYTSRGRRSSASPGPSSSWRRAGDHRGGLRQGTSIGVFDRGSSPSGTPCAPRGRSSALTPSPPSPQSTLPGCGRWTP